MAEYLIINKGGRVKCPYYTIIIKKMKPSEVLKQIRELNKVWREQNFVYTPEQQSEFDKLKQLRRKRVKYFYDNDLVFKGAAKKDDTK